MDLFHPVVGGMLVREWGLSPWIEVSSEHHHDYTQTPEHKTEGMLTCLADHLAHWAMGTSEVTIDEIRRLEVVSDLDLYDDDLQRLVDGKDRAIEIAEAFA